MNVKGTYNYEHTITDGKKTYKIASLLFLLSFKYNSIEFEVWLTAEGDYITYTPQTRSVFHTTEQDVLRYFSRGYIKTKISSYLADYVKNVPVGSTDPSPEHFGKHKRAS